MLMAAKSQPYLLYRVASPSLSCLYPRQLPFSLHYARLSNVTFSRHKSTSLIAKTKQTNKSRLDKRHGISIKRSYQTLECEPDNRQPQTGKSKPSAPSSPGSIDTMQFNLTDPRTIVKHLDDYVIGQEQAKKILAVAVYNHYCRVQANLAKYQQENDRLEMEDRNQVEHHHSTLPQDYYTSTPIESVGADLVPAERLSSYGKLSQRRTWLNPPTQMATHNRFLEDMETSHSKSTLNKQTNNDHLDGSIIHDKSNVLIIGPTGTGKTLMTKTLAKVLGVPFSSNDATPLTMAGYVGEDVEVVIHRLLETCDYDVKKAETGIIFIDEIDKIARRSGSSSQSKDVSGEGVQQSLLRLLEGTKVTLSGSNGSSKRPYPGGSLGYMKSEPITVDTSNILFILSGAFIGLDDIVKDRLAKGSIGFDAMLKSKSEDTVDVKQGDDILSVPPLQLVEPEDLVKFGFIPEFVGRVPVVASVANLQVDDLVRILSEPKNSLIKQYKDLFRLNDVDLHFSTLALRKIAEQALEKKTGARGLRRIMEQILLDLMYDTPSISNTTKRLWRALLIISK
ncbi:P-loop containing nucleoside triphosphate hydrolase protein [Chlamydoabsidia padenii]|nr:P-loop containing nucleoside triphosphate hydrolase protein [Chlamydoabsidia padenii]